MMRMRHALDPRWRGETPRSYWFDRKGIRAAAHSGLITPAVIDKLLPR